MHECPRGQGTGRGAEPVSSWVPPSPPRALHGAGGTGSPPGVRGHPCTGGAGDRAGAPLPLPPAPALTEGPSPESEEAEGLPAAKLVSAEELKVSPGRAELGQTAWLGSAGRGRAPAGGCRAERTQGAFTRVGDPHAPGTPIPASSSAPRPPAPVQRCLPGVLQDPSSPPGVLQGPPVPRSPPSPRVLEAHLEDGEAGLGRGQAGGHGQAVLAGLALVDGDDLEGGRREVQVGQAGVLQVVEVPLRQRVPAGHAGLGGAAPAPPAPPGPERHLLPFSWVFLLCSKSAASLKETRRAAEELEDRNRSLSASR